MRSSVYICPLETALWSNKSFDLNFFTSLPKASYSVASNTSIFVFGIYGSFSGILFDHWDYDIISLKDEDNTYEKATIAGPSCDSLDIVKKEMFLYLDQIILKIIYKKI